MPTYNMRIFLLEYIVNKFEDATLGDTGKERKKFHNGRKDRNGNAGALLPAVFVLLYYTG